jgi:hypothetical protein
MISRLTLAVGGVITTPLDASGPGRTLRADTVKKGLKAGKKTGNVGRSCASKANEFVGSPKCKKGRYSDAAVSPAAPRSPNGGHDERWLHDSSRGK